MAQAEVLEALYNEGCCSSKQLSLIVGIASNNVVKNMRWYIKKGYIGTKNDPNCVNRVFYFLTPKGKDFMKRFFL
jgi:DNA-binding MarR family transcriptional regulator